MRSARLVHVAGNASSASHMCVIRTTTPHLTLHTRRHHLSPCDLAPWEFGVAFSEVSLMKFVGAIYPGYNTDTLSGIPRLSQYKNQTPNEAVAELVAIASSADLVYFAECPSVRRRRESMAKDAGAAGSIYAPPTTEPEIRFQP